MRILIKHILRAMICFLCCLPIAIGPSYADNKLSPSDASIDEDEPPTVDTSPEENQPHSADSGIEEDEGTECPQLFGSLKRKGKNKNRRKQYLYSIIEEPSGVTIFHLNQDWEEPFTLKMQGVALTEVNAHKDSNQRTATIMIADQLADTIGCESGEYDVRRDDSIGKKTIILAVLQNGLLVEAKGQLGYLRRPKTATPRWLVAWTLKGTYRVRSSSSHPPRRHPPKRRRPKPSPRRRRR